MILSLRYHRILNGDIENEIVHKLLSFHFFFCCVVYVSEGDLMIINFHKSSLQALCNVLIFKNVPSPVQAFHRSLHEVPMDAGDEMMKNPFAVDHDYSTCVASLAESHRH